MRLNSPAFDRARAIRIAKFTRYNNYIIMVYKVSSKVWVARYQPFPMIRRREVPGWQLAILVPATVTPNPP